MSGEANSKYKPEYDEQARKLCLLGAIDRDLGSFFDVTEQTINNWKEDHPSFFESIKEAKKEADSKVVRSLFERATGYEHPEDKIFQNDGKELIVPTIKHYPPDTVAAIFWLKNRDKENWKDKQQIEHSGDIGNNGGICRASEILEGFRSKGQNDPDEGAVQK